ncbi:MULTISPECIES: ABC transporter ATP-binding protein [Mucilaginibacter]|jgi:phospholipid/cholesterol/gamma-HCH transport system ATP-binding protein|uniref:ATP-binding cassette domain-containing protein n=2 Tax=Mucilaginibacter TaxID=423349 RepID=A0AAE6JL64_9SPHI|nr:MULTISPECIES: ATP-binding cassette domain-containing protein [Mucilaginibacter]NVM66178.1 phospholipid/cholesterol/gamma-HCH transport system ATP-binding protein [Mucilaginibacter sp. SG538B]QEM07962.1 ATP-binding cassette domain-containing protein [Mucilaginibacter rubeus]QEM20413.1 ATP-binding cassette domain-containing protein [Mucilaginibacter gossypii]QTE34675.1 ATP-binding cassette domain-containing protein [Mucilaginibacter gossypii]QTE42864.1 ATP-binding cassette domain-containing p
MIEIQDVYKSFGENEVLKGITAIFHPGKNNLIIGGSGSGKTTLLKCIVGLHEPTKGDVIFDGENFTNMNFEQRVPIRTQIGMLFQNSALFDSMTVEQNIMFPLNLFTDQSKSEKLDRANFCLERVNLAGKNKLYPSELSGGMKKRVGIARAISMQPKYLFVDEPNSGLDPVTSILIDELIAELTAEYSITTVVVTHDMNSVMGIGDHIIFLHQGKKWWEGSNKEIAKTDNKELNEFVFASPFMRAAKATL